MVKAKVRYFFKSKFDRDLGLQVRLDNVGFNTIFRVDNAMLVGAFLEEEIKNGVWRCDSSKSHGPDGFNFGFIKFCWDCLKKNILLAVNDFANRGKWPRGSNTLFMFQIPKSVNPQELCDFRPISLVGCLFKIISKILSIRLKKMMNKVINVGQSAFFNG